ncbi:MAG: hypothetical protein R3A44_23275 [Caldilineaceae bacterium]
MQLAALSMQGRADVSAFIQSFSGSHRHVFSYLIEEVLNQRPTGTLDFLLQTAILERFNADLCNIVTGRSDSQALLAKIEQANLFLIPLDDKRRWYRYHHLFAEVLHQRLQRSFPAAVVADRHLRASAWYEQTESIDEAIHHALAAQAFARAATLVEQVASAMIQHSELAKLLRLLEILPAAEIRIRPLLGVYFAWGFFLSGQVVPAFPRAHDPPPGQMVAGGGYRLHIFCAGSGSPTVIMESGVGDSSLFWSHERPESVKTTGARV